MLKDKSTHFKVIVCVIITFMMCNTNNFEKAKKLMKKGNYREALPILEIELKNSPQKVMDFLYKCVESKDSLFSNSAGELLCLCGESFAKNFEANESTYYFLNYYACKLPKHPVFYFCEYNFSINYWAGGKHCIPNSSKFWVKLPVLYTVELCSLPDPLILIMNRDGEIFVEAPLENYKKEFSSPQNVIASNLVLGGKNPMLLIDYRTPIYYVVELLSYIKSQKYEKILLHYPGYYPPYVIEKLATLDEEERKILMPVGYEGRKGRGEIPHPVGYGGGKFISQTGLYLDLCETESSTKIPKDSLIISIYSGGSFKINGLGYEGFNKTAQQSWEIVDIVENKMMERGTFLVILLETDKNTEWGNVINVVSPITDCSIYGLDGRELQPAKICFIAEKDETKVHIVVKVIDIKEERERKSYTGTQIEALPYHKVEVKPQPITIPRPEYPEAAKEAGIEGITIVKMLVDIDGSVIDVQVLKSSGNKILDEAAVASARKARFRPAKNQDKLVRVWVNMPVEFKRNKE